MNLNNKSTGSSYTSPEWNELKNEPQNLILSSGQTLTSNSIQLQQAVARYVANAGSYTDSGIANAYSLVAINTNDSVSAYFNGIEVSFKAGNSNTGSSTLALPGLAAKTIKKNGFTSDVVSGDIIAGRIYKAFYSLSDDAFEISDYSATSGGVPNALTSDTWATITVIATVVAVVGSNNFASPVRDSTGLYTYTFSSAMPNLEYTISGFASRTGGGNEVNVSLVEGTKTINGFQVTVNGISSGNQQDPTVLDITVGRVI